MCNFDLENGYYHIDIFEPHQKFLGSFFIFTVSPFRITSAPFIFTKVKSLVKYCRSNTVKITCFLDDGICIEYYY